MANSVINKHVNDVTEDIIKNGVTVPANGVYIENIALTKPFPSAKLKAAQLVRFTKGADTITSMIHSYNSDSNLIVCLRSFYDTDFTNLGYTIRLTWGGGKHTFAPRAVAQVAA